MEKAWIKNDSQELKINWIGVSIEVYIESRLSRVSISFVFLTSTIEIINIYNLETRISFHCSHSAHRLSTTSPLVWLPPSAVHHNISMPYCERCDRHFGSWSALNRHETDSFRHHKCVDCSKDFSTRTGLIQHWVQSPRHSYCQNCDEHFDDFSELEDHDANSHFYCTTCKKNCANDYGLHEHYRQSSLHHYCPPCKRLFISESNLRSVSDQYQIVIMFIDQPRSQHLSSATHRPKNVPCPFRGCGMKFVSHSALILHLEGGACPSRMDRSAVNKFVRQYDTNNIITDPSRLLTDGNTRNNIKYYASERSWNGDAFECYLCHRGYSSLTALNQHLGSPAHEGKIYICPASTCRARFTTLSALCQHIESQKCGVAMFKNFGHHIDGILGGMGRLTL